MTVAEQVRYDCRVAFAETLIGLARENSRIVAVCNDSVGSSNLTAFKAEFPDRLINVGIAEQTLVGVGAGLATSGYVPFVCAASPFLTARSLEQIKADVAYSQAPVVLCGMSPGLAYGELGPTHHSIEDLSWMRAIADLTIVVPADPKQTREAVTWAAGAATAAFLRIGRFKVPAVTPEDTPLRIGHADELVSGDDVTIIATGAVVAPALDAAAMLREEGIAARVLNMATIAPLDEEAVSRAVQETRGIITVEEATITGGLGAAVAEVNVRRSPKPMRMLGIPRQFAPTGSTGFLLETFGLTPDGIASAARELASRYD